MVEQENNGGSIRVGELAKALGVARPTLVRVITEEESRDPNFKVGLLGGKFDPEAANRIAHLVRTAREEKRITPNYLHQRKRPTTEF